MKKEILALLLLLAFGIPLVLAQTDTVEVIVNVSTTIAIDILQVNVTWNESSIAPGSTSASRTIDVKNVGSVNVTNLYASITYETNNPNGKNISNYYSGRFFALRNSTNATYYFVNRAEYNISYLPSGFTKTAGVGNRSWGFFGNVSQNFMWELYNGSVGGDKGSLLANFSCNATDAVLKVSATRDDGMGSQRTVATVGAPTATAVDWAIFAPTASGIWNNYCVAAYWNCSYIVLYHYDYDIAGGGVCTNKRYLRQDVLTPGAVESLQGRAFVEYGVPAGMAYGSTLTVTASAAA